MTTEKEYKLNLKEKFNPAMDIIECPKCKKQTLYHKHHVLIKNYNYVSDENGVTASWYCENDKCKLRLWS